MSLQCHFIPEREPAEDMTWKSFLSQRSCMRHSLIQARPWCRIYCRALVSEREDLRNAAYYNGKIKYTQYREFSIEAFMIKIIHFEPWRSIELPLSDLRPQRVGPVNATALSDSLFSCVLHRFIHERCPWPKKSRSLVSRPGCC